MSHNLNKILKYIIYSGLFLVPLVPLVVADSLFFPFIAGKNFAFRIITEIVVGAWAVLAIRNKNYRPKFSWLLINFIAFVGIMGVADLLGANPAKSFWSNFERMEGWVTILHLLGYFIVLGTMLNTEKLWNRFFNTSIGVSVFICLYGILQLLGKITINQGGVRVDATFGNAAYLAIYLLFNFFITLILFVKRREKKFAEKKKFLSFGAADFAYIFAMFLQLFILYHTATRGAILGLFGGLLIVFIFFFLSKNIIPPVKKIGTYGLITFSVIAILFFSLKDASFIKNSPVLSRISSISMNEISRSRLPVWNMAMKGFSERPIIGWGQENFNYVFDKNYDPKMYNQEQWFDRAHNVFLDWLIAGGILGLLIYLCFYFFGIKYVWSGGEENKFSISEKILLLGLFAGYFFHSIFVFDNITSYLMFFSVLAYIHSRTPIRQNEKEKLVNINNEWIKNVVVVAVIFTTLFSIYFFNAKGILSGRTFIKALVKSRSQNFSEGLDLFKKALAYNAYSKLEIREQLAQIASELASNQNIDLQAKQQFFDTAKDEMLKQIEKDPENARYEVFAGALYNRYKMYDEAIRHLEKSLQLSPNKQSIMFELGTSYLNKGRDKDALEILKKAFDGDQTYIDARIIYAIAAIYSGENKLAEGLLVPVWGTALVHDDRIVKAYFDTGQFDKVIQISKERIEKEPNNIQFRVALALAYVKSGMKNEAIGEIRQAMVLNPSFKSDGEKIIKGIEEGNI